MQFIADLHLHSKYSRATSSRMDLENLDKWARIKGMKVLGTGDFTHPEWLKTLKEKLEPAEPGLFVLKESLRQKEPGITDEPTRFLLSVEISCIYSQGGRLRKIHHIIFAPSFKAVEEINTRLGWIGNLRADGRPILGMTSQELAEIVFGASEECLLVPAHCWTPWFAIFGSKSGFDSLEECFGRWSSKIYALETGLSSDLEMNWRLSRLDKLTLISNSDSHSPERIGREANVFNAELSYQAIIKAIKKGTPDKFPYTIEFYPHEGRYHYDGHRKCGVRLSPTATKKAGGICPRCGQPLTLGVMYRVEELADKEKPQKPPQAHSYRHLVQLDKIIAEALGVGPASKQVWSFYFTLVKQVAPEFPLLLEADLKDIAQASTPKIAEGIKRVREGKITIKPGYDGVYGEIRVFGEAEQKEKAWGQETLF